MALLFSARAPRPSFARLFVVWLVMLATMVGNGALRDLAYGDALPGLAGQQVSTLTGLLLLGVIIWLYVRFWPPVSGRQALAIGLLWMTLTIIFEFLFFHFVAGHSWSALLANYDLSVGRLWGLIPLWLALAPYLFLRFRS